MESMPLLPGYSPSSFGAMPKTNNRLKQKLKFMNGFPVLRDSYDLDDCAGNVKHVELDPSLTYGRRKQYNHFEQQRFLPHYVLHAGQCLSFDAYFRQGIFGSPNEQWRVRRVKIVYYLEDDSMCVREPKLENAGYKQGTLVKRQKIPRWNDSEGRCYHWKDLNVAMDIAIYGVVYRIYGCDLFSREFLTSQGVDVAEPEDVPPDPYLRDRLIELNQRFGPSSNKDSTRVLANSRGFRFIEYDGMVLTFDAQWNGEAYKVRYFLGDDTIAVFEVRRPNDGKDRDLSGLLLKRTKVPKNWKDLPASYPSVYLEKSDEEVREFYSPKDLRVGSTAFIFGRRFLLLDCDPFTRRYYSAMLQIEQPPRLRLPEESAPTCLCKPESSRPHSEDLIRRLYLYPKKLRYSLSFDVIRPEDEGRQFVLEYSLADGAVRINEFPRRNSGRREGCFLGWTRVPKPGTDQYFTPEDFAIGKKLNIYGHWFVVTGTDPYVYKYMMANPQKFSEDLVRGVREHLQEKCLIGKEMEKMSECGRAEEEEEGGKGELLAGDEADKCEEIKEESTAKPCEFELIADDKDDKDCGEKKVRGVSWAKDNY